MKIEQQFLSISELVKLKDEINLNPIWQRGPAWRRPRQVLLVDTILRGMDIPKVYLRLQTGGAHRYVAVDGQQRLRALWEFAAGDWALDHPDGLGAIDGEGIAGCTYETLPKILRDRFDVFLVSVAEIVEATNDEITNLFSRLQMGVALNPAELRNAILSPLRHVIDAIGASHEFFVESRIPEARYKRQDYAAHAFAMAHFKAERNIKAPDLKAMVQSFTAKDTDQVLLLNEQVSRALSVLGLVNGLDNFQITQKWIFVDLAWLIMQRHAAGATVSPIKLAAAYAAFEARRREHRSNPEALVRDRPNASELDLQLYRYIHAFKAQGSEHQNLKVRADALRAFCPDIDEA